MRYSPFALGLLMTVSTHVLASDLKDLNEGSSPSTTTTTTTAMNISPQEYQKLAAMMKELPNELWMEIQSYLDPYSKKHLALMQGWARSVVDSKQESFKKEASPALKWELREILENLSSNARKLFNHHYTMSTYCDFKDFLANSQPVKMVLDEGLKLRASFRLNGIQIHPWGAKALAEMLETSTTLKRLELVRDRIEGEGAKAFAEMLETNTTLEILNLEYNRIGDAGAKAFADALKENRTLQALHLGSNNIGNEGAPALGAMLQRNTTLQSLNLDLNKIGDAGAMALAEALATNRNLRVLSLVQNGIGDAGAMALAAGLKENRALIMLFLSSDQIGADGRAALRALKETHPHLRIVIQSTAPW